MATNSKPPAPTSQQLQRWRARGAVLNARCSMAMGRVMAPIDEERGNDYFLQAWDWAFEAACGSVVDQPPFLFEEEGTLLDGWQEGRRLVREQAAAEQARAARRMQLARKLRGGA